MGRPKKYDGERVSTGLRLPVELHARLTTAAAERDVSATWLIERALTEFLDHLIPVDEIRWTR
jgi:predicted HicB family RNase H-like nuclease